MGSEIESESESESDYHTPGEIGDRVDIAGLLFTPERDFLVKNNGDKVRIDDLKGKTIVLYISPLYEYFNEPNDTVDMIQAHNELLPLGGVEFVFVPVYLHSHGSQAFQEGRFNSVFSTLPFPAIPFSEAESCRDRVVKAFSFDSWPHWVVIDHTSTVVATRRSYHYLFRVFGGAELHPLSPERIHALWDEYQGDNYDRWESRKRLISNWDQLLASPARDFLLSSNGTHLLLKDKVIGLYFCENMKSPPNMELIKKVYQEAKSRGYDFEIVQINFDYYWYHNVCRKVGDMPEQDCKESVSWLTLPFKDPSCRKLQRIFKCNSDDWQFMYDCVVIIDPRQGDTNGVLFEFSGVKILRKYGIEGYPFTRQHLYELEYGRQEKRVKLQSFFPPGLCHLIRPAGDGFDMTDGSQLTGKRVIVLFANHSECVNPSAFVSMLKSKYLEQLNDEIEENKFEVVYVSTEYDGSSFTESIKDMPWLVHPHSRDFTKQCREKMLKVEKMLNVSSTALDMNGVAAFDLNGELIAKVCYSGRHDTSYKLCFPFVSLDWKERIRLEVGETCDLDQYNQVVSIDDLDLYS